MRMYTFVIFTSTVVKKSIPSGTTSKENNVSRSTAKSDAINRQALNTNKTKDAHKSGVTSNNKPSQLSSSSKPALPNKTTHSSKFEEAKRDPGGASSNKKPDNSTSKTSVKPTSSVSVKTNNSSRNVKDTTVTPRVSSRSLERSQQQENIYEETIADVTNVPPDYSNIVDGEEEPVKETSTLPTDGFDKSLHVSPDFPSIDSGITIEQPLDNSTVIMI